MIKNLFEPIPTFWIFIAMERYEKSESTIDSEYRYDFKICHDCDIVLFSL